MLNSQHLLTGFGGAAATLASAYAPQPTSVSGASAFRDLLATLTALEQTQQRLVQQQTEMDDRELPGLTPLFSAPLHLSIEMTGLRQLSADEVTALAAGTLDLSASAPAGSLQLILPQLTAGGSLSYTLIQLQLVQGGTPALGPIYGTAQGTAIGQLPLALASGSAGLQQFLAEAWEHTGVRGAFLIDATQVTGAPPSQSKLLQELLDMAYTLLQYLNNLEMLRAFQISKQEKKRMEAALKAAEIAAEKEARMRALRQQQAAEDALIKMLNQRRLLAEDIQQEVQARSLGHRLVHFFSQTQHRLQQGHLVPAQLNALLGEAYRLDLDMRAALAAQSLARSGSAA
ncbi:MAG: hypothetical protein IGS03_05880 [Candidatus Sericytochromatia bacterium]|nr:hypothetical protein [Candidatus Sericytochromatia bacterium]